MNIAYRLNPDHPWIPLAKLDAKVLEMPGKRPIHLKLWLRQDDPDDRLVIESIIARLSK